MQRQINPFCGYTGGFRLPPKDGGKTSLGEYSELLANSTRLFAQEMHRQVKKDLDFLKMLYPPREPLTYWEEKKVGFIARFTDIKWRICKAWQILKDGDPAWD